MPQCSKFLCLGKTTKHRYSGYSTCFCPSSVSRVLALKFHLKPVTNNWGFWTALSQAIHPQNALSQSSPLFPHVYSKFCGSSMSLPGVSFLGHLGIFLLILVADHETSRKSG